MHKALRVLLACLAGVLPLAAQAEAAGEVRYVWADQLVLRAAPNTKAREVARLPYGTKLVQLSNVAAPVAHSETMTGLRGSENRLAADLTLDGNWRQVQAQGKRGWVFDGYLSRYPAPGNVEDPGNYDDDELAYAAQVFGVAPTWQWNKGDSNASESYKTMRRKWKLDMDAGPAEIYWTRVEFKSSGAAEKLSIIGDGSTDNLAIEGMPMSFNEALLWWHHFHFFESSGKFISGRSLEAGPTDDDTTGLGFEHIIQCGAQTCDIRRDMTD